MDSFKFDDLWHGQDGDDISIFAILNLLAAFDGVDHMFLAGTCYISGLQTSLVTSLFPGLIQGASFDC